MLFNNVGQIGAVLMIAQLKGINGVIVNQYVLGVRNGKGGVMKKSKKDKDKRDEMELILKQKERDDLYSAEMFLPLIKGE